MTVGLSFRRGGRYPTLTTTVSLEEKIQKIKFKKNETTISVERGLRVRPLDMTHCRTATAIAAL